MNKSRNIPGIFKVVTSYPVEALCYSLPFVSVKETSSRCISRDLGWSFESQCKAAESEPGELCRSLFVAHATDVVPPVKHHGNL